MKKLLLFLGIAVLGLSTVQHTALAGGSDSGGSDSGGSDSGGSDSGDSGSSGSDSRGSGYGPKPAVKAKPQVQTPVQSSTTPAVKVDALGNTSIGADGVVNGDGTSVGAISGVDTPIDPATYKITTVIINGPFCKNWELPHLYFLPIPLPRGGTISIPKSNPTEAIRRYIRTNYLALETELSSGSGPRLDGLFDLMGCVVTAKEQMIKSMRAALTAHSKTPAYKSNSQQANADEMFKHLIAVAYASYSSDCSKL